MSKSAISILVVNYNSAKFVQGLAKSLKKSTFSDYELLILDNDSTAKDKNLLAKVESNETVWSPTNLGFGNGMDLLAKKARGKYLLILNPDSLVEPDTLELLVAEAEQQKKLGMLSCKIVFSDGRLQISAHKKYPNLANHLYEYCPLYNLFIQRLAPNYHPTAYSPEEHEKTLEPKHLLGAAILIPKTVYDKVGGFDKNYFLYREETDLALQVSKAGYKIIYTPATTLVHYSGQSSHNDFYASLNKFYIKSVYYYFRKNNGILYALLAWLVGWLGLLVSMVVLMPLYYAKVLTGRRGQLGNILLSKMWQSFKYHFVVLAKGFSA